MRVLLAIPGSGVGTRIQPSNTGLTLWEYEPEGDQWSLHSFNEAVHLVGLPVFEDP